MRVLEVDDHPIRVGLSRGEAALGEVGQRVLEADHRPGLTATVASGVRRPAETAWDVGRGNTTNATRCKRPVAAVDPLQQHCSRFSAAWKKGHD